jgi:nitronate monooxygenase
VAEGDGLLNRCTPLKVYRGFESPPLRCCETNPVNAAPPNGAKMRDTTTPTWANTRVAARLGIKYPIIQGPLGGLSSQRLTAAVSNAGGLGSFGGVGLTPGAIQDAIGEIRSLTDKPFAMNLWVSTEDAGAKSSGQAAFNQSLATVAPLIQSLGGTLPAYKPYAAPSFDEQVRVLLDLNVPVFSFIFGIPPGEILRECRAKGIVTIGTATTPDEAAALEEANVDVIVASGFEAGGHRGSFLRASEDSLMGTFSLVPQVADRVSVPVVAAGGIADARGILAALILGAQGVQIGTAFLACEESGASPPHREALLSGRAGHTALTRGFTGRLARGIKNRLLDAMNAPGVDILPYPLQRYLIRNVTSLAEKAGRQELMPMWAGQSANFTHHTRAAELLETLVLDVSAMMNDRFAVTGKDDAR